MLFPRVRPRKWQLAETPIDTEYSYDLFMLPQALLYP